MAQQWSQHWLPSRPGLAAWYENVPCWSTLDFYINIEHFPSNVIPTPGLLLVLASAYRQWITKLPWPPSSPATPASRERWPLMTTPCDSSSVPSLRMVDGSRVTLFVCSLSLLSSSTSESDGPLSSPQRVLVASSFARPSSPCAPLLVSPLPCLSSNTIWLVLWLVTVLQGPCQ